MHNGYFKTLRGVVHFYNTRDVLPVCPGDLTEAEALAEGCWAAPEVSENLNLLEVGNLGLTEAEEGALGAFLDALSDGWLRHAPPHRVVNKEPVGAQGCSKQPWTDWSSVVAPNLASPVPPHIQ